MNRGVHVVAVAADQTASGGRSTADDRPTHAETVIVGVFVGGLAEFFVDIAVAVFVDPVFVADFEAIVGRDEDVVVIAVVPAALDAVSAVLVPVREPTIQALFGFFVTLLIEVAGRLSGRALADQRRPAVGLPALTGLKAVAEEIVVARPDRALADLDLEALDRVPQTPQIGPRAVLVITSDSAGECENVCEGKCIRAATPRFRTGHAQLVAESQPARP